MNLEFSATTIFWLPLVLILNYFCFQYGSYCVNLPLAVERLEQLSEVSMPLKKQLLELQQAAHPPTFPLSSHLVLPFQRFLKYHLLLKVRACHRPQFKAPNFYLILKKGHDL